MSDEIAEIKDMLLKQNEQQSLWMKFATEQTATKRIDEEDDEDDHFPDL